MSDRNFLTSQFCKYRKIVKVCLVNLIKADLLYLGSVHILKEGYKEDKCVTGYWVIEVLVDK